MDRLFTAVHCLECGRDMPADLFTTRCTACKGVWLEARYDCAALPVNWLKTLAERPTDAWRYRELLPFPRDFQPVSMGEGWTSLTRAQRLEREWGYQGTIWIKDERRQPTGSFKDRQAAFTVSALKAQGIDELALASTGNAAAAYAAYCARAGIKLWVFLNNSVPAEKIRELALYGAEVIRTSGTYDEAKVVAADFAVRRGIYYDKGAKAIPGKESMKTIALEIAEQLGFALSTGWRAPDWYVQAVSGGIGPLGVLKGFTELNQAGLIDRIPKLAIVQSEGCAPMVRAWERGLSQAEPVEPDTLVTVLATGKPGLAYEILKQAADRHGGAMVAVTDGEAFRAMRRVARIEGISMEPAASVAFAGAEKLLTTGVIQPGECVVVNCSGHTFSAEKHVLEDRYTLRLQTDVPSAELEMALAQLDEQTTTIAVIEDNPYDSRLIRRLLQKHKGYRIFEAHNGQDGLDLVRQRQPNLVLLDLTLPDLDGFTVLQKLKADARTRDIPVVVVSARSLSGDESAHLSPYTRSIWQKGSFSAHELIRNVVEILGDDLEPSLFQSEPAGVPIDAFGNGRRSRILVIDDHASDTRLMRRLFEARQRFQVLEAHSGAEALAAIGAALPDLIVLDLMLPDLDGEQLLRTLRVRQETQDIPVIVLSAKELNPEARAELSAQVDSVWVKGTLDRSSLLAHVETLLVEE